ncbi:MAG TPA: A/G-specific adenine glycosylase [Bellilinea sp.]|nr:A/G-specific adenine glycosylase [Bellilinea sp.]
MPSEFPRRLLAWYADHARELPWRGHADPYAVWVSEIMLQQTRVETVIPYFERWMRRFPTIKDLAQADEQDVLHTWEGLGYYSRARNLHRAAREVMSRYGGQLPASLGDLESLPGIGRYTAGAIGSMAFGLDAPALDGNLRRVLARIFNLTMPIRSPEGEQALARLLAEHLPAGQAGDFNQAMMDLGATICLPRSPDCEHCPIAEICQSRQLGIQEERPVMAERRAVPHYAVTAAVIQRDGQLLIARRPPDGLLGGMWEFPGGKQEPGETLAECLEREIREELGAVVTVGAEVGVFRHAYTHFKVTLHAFYCTLAEGEPHPIEVSAIRWVEAGELAAFPMGKIDRQISLHLSKALKI